MRPRSVQEADPRRCCEALQRGTDRDREGYERQTRGASDAARDSIRTQAVQLGGQFQSKLNTANATLSGNQKVQSQLADEHAKILAQYQADATAAMASYQATRKQLVAKYSAVAHMQFQDNVALSMQAEQLAQERKHAL